MALSNLPIFAEETSSLETANEVAALGGTTFDSGSTSKSTDLTRRQIIVQYIRIIFNTMAEGGCSSTRNTLSGYATEGVRESIV